MSKIYEYKSISGGFKDTDLKQGIVSGYFSAFNTKDSDGDIIVPGFFKKSILERGPKSERPRIKWFIDHDPTQVPGSLKELEEDTHGLHYVGKSGTHALGRDFILMVESEVITEHSIGFKTLKDDKKSDARYLIEGQLWEGSSLKAWGANEFTPITGMKSEEKINKIQERMNRLEKFCRNSTATDETIESLLIEMKQLNQLLIDIISEKSTPAAVEAQEPVKEDLSALEVGLYTFTKNLKLELI